ncbi:Larval cuticle protein LCP-17 [Amphibalanus amphitrite]|uniref:Larval cuticle protein LCP-17 n=1 Tax=Amphibalanus amphitrite TaxID=1232801 RepID=A0A6A4VQF7_AMPAM|nr:larval cuticle protein 9-like [Amphibalanus amphitrite]XP_043241987.1 larval cuticle protein 9-like [Amphibalanus amphitrite]KAF0293640.1 Larval cuticle protein LCP-17 [Amphibalanus amphitrite]
MKLMIVLALVAVAAAQDDAQYVAGSDRDAQIVKNDFSMDEAGGFVADMETSNNIQQGATGTSYPGQDPETGSYTMSGQYSYVAPNGQTVTVTWTADENGYSAESDAIPQLSAEHQAAIDGSVGALPETFSDSV